MVDLEPYERLFGFVPELTKIRHRFSTEIFPEILEIQETFREICMHSNALEDRQTQMILFAMLASQYRKGAKVHAIASRRIGVSWKELHGVANLIFLFGGLSAMNFAIQILAEVKEEELNDPATLTCFNQECSREKLSDSMKGIKK